nr:hypothetical protein CFP56_36386 [Quercus suber]
MRLDICQLTRRSSGRAKHQVLLGWQDFATRASSNALLNSLGWSCAGGSCARLSHRIVMMALGWHGREKLFDRDQGTTSRASHGDPAVITSFCVRAPSQEINTTSLVLVKLLVSMQLVLCHDTDTRLVKWPCRGIV